MNFPVLLKFLFSKYFLILLLLIFINGLFLLAQYPHFIYDNFIETVSIFLRHNVGTGGNISKISSGFSKLGLMLILLSVGLFSFLPILKWLLSSPITGERSLSLPFRDTFQKKDWFIIVALLLAGVLLRIFPLHQSLWLDEIAVYDTFIKDGAQSSFFPKSSLGSHPFMQIIVAWFIKIFGTTEFTLRFPIFLVSVLSIPLIYYISLSLTGKKSTAFLAAFLLTIHSYHIYYSFQMRGYNLVIFFSMLSIYYLIKVLTGSGGITNLLFVVTNALLVFTHLQSIYLMIAELLVIMGILCYQKITKITSDNQLSNKHAANYFQLFIISMLLIFLLYIPQFPVVFMNIFDPDKPESSYSNYFLQVINTAYFFVTYSDRQALCYAFVAAICLLFLFSVKKINVSRLIFYTGIVFFILTAILPNGSGFFPRYIVCIIPCFIFIYAMVTIELWSSENKISKIFAIALSLTYLVLTAESYAKTYQPIQNFRGAVDYIHASRENPNATIVSISLGKDLVRYYDKSIIPLPNIEAYDSIIQLKQETFALMTYENAVGHGSFIIDKEILRKINQDFLPAKTFDGEFPIYVWHRK